LELITLQGKIYSKECYSTLNYYFNSKFLGNMLEVKKIVILWMFFIKSALQM